MKKLVISAFSFLLLNPCVSHSMDEHTDESHSPKKQYTQKNKPSEYSFKQKSYSGKFIGTDEKRDVAIYEETSNAPFMTRLRTLWDNSWWSTK